jgi:hypothetical protein
LVPLCHQYLPSDLQAPEVGSSIMVTSRASVDLPHPIRRPRPGFCPASSRKMLASIERFEYRLVLKSRRDDLVMALQVSPP